MTPGSISCFELKEIYNYFIFNSQFEPSLIWIPSQNNRGGSVEVFRPMFT